MKKIILIGATLLATSGAILIANNRDSIQETCCDKTNALIRQLAANNN